MTIPTVSWDETAPAGNTSINLGDNRIRELKTQLREVIEVDHKFGSSGQDADNGKHNKCSFLEQANLGTGSVGEPILGAQTVSGKAELVFTDEDDNDIQLTSSGKLGGSSTQILGSTVDCASLLGDAIKIDTNNTYIKSKNAAGSGTVDLIKADTLDVVVIPDGTETATNAAPASDKDVSNKKYVDDQIAAAETIKAWINFAGATGTATDSFNATSSRDSTGVYTITWGTDFANTNYAVVVGVESTDNNVQWTFSNKAAGSIKVRVYRGNVASDETGISVMAIGDQ